MIMVILPTLGTYKAEQDIKTLTIWLGTLHLEMPTPGDLV